MSSHSRERTSLSDVLYQNRRQLRDVGNIQPGISLPRKAMRYLDLLDEDGVDTDAEALVAVYDDGRVVIELDTDE